MRHVELQVPQELVALVRYFSLHYKLLLILVQNVLVFIGLTDKILTPDWWRTQAPCPLRGVKG